MQINNPKEEWWGDRRVFWDAIFKHLTPETVGFIQMEVRRLIDRACEDGQRLGRVEALVEMEDVINEAIPENTGFNIARENFFRVLTKLKYLGESK